MVSSDTTGAFSESRWQGNVHQSSSIKSLNFKMYHWHRIAFNFFICPIESPSCSHQAMMMMLSKLGSQIIIIFVSRSCIIREYISGLPIFVRTTFKWEKKTYGICSPLHSRVFSGGVKFQKNPRFVSTKSVPFPRSHQRSSKDVPS